MEYKVLSITYELCLASYRTTLSLGGSWKEQDFSLCRHNITTRRNVLFL